MTDTAIVGENVEVLQANEVFAPPPTLSWATIIAGALAATAISFILLSLGAGVGFLTASPYNMGPSAAALTAGAAIWIVLAQTWGFACGGYLAARVRSVAPVVSAQENTFRDGVHGFVVWALGVVLTTVVVGLSAAFAVGMAAHVGATLGAGAATGAAMQPQEGRSATDPTAYFAEVLLRPAAPAAAGQARQAAQQPEPQTQQQQVQGGIAAQPSAAPSNADIARILATGMAQGQLSDADRDYLVRVVMARTGLPEAEARQRVTDVETRLRETVKEAADKAAKAASYFSFWTFMSLLMGAAAATAGGVFGGTQRDAELLAPSMDTLPLR